MQEPVLWQCTEPPVRHPPGVVVAPLNGSRCPLRADAAGGCSCLIIYQGRLQVEGTKSASGAGVWTWQLCKKITVDGMDMCCVYTADNQVQNIPPFWIDYIGFQRQGTGLLSAWSPTYPPILGGARLPSGSTDVYPLQFQTGYSSGTASKTL